ncbi:PIR protein, putative [Plasmodium sp. gorilla clade G1]|nr:PIR protein, putative [Plasmodium sp. gorilla clade G1]
MLLFAFLFNALLLSQNVSFRNNNYNIRFTQNIRQHTSTKSRHLAEIEKPKNPHYHNDPELKEIIDKLNKEAIKKYQKTHEPYEQLQELVEKKLTKTRGAYGAEPMSMIEKELLKTYEEMFGDQSHIMLKSGMYTNEGNKSCECAYKKKSSSSNKVHEKYLNNLKEGCIAGVGTCAFSSALLGKFGIAAAAAAAYQAAINSFQTLAPYITSNIIGVNFFFLSSLEAAIKAITPVPLISLIEKTNIVGSAVSAGTTTFFPYAMAIVALIAVTIIFIILYVWLRKRRKKLMKS